MLEDEVPNYWQIVSNKTKDIVQMSRNGPDQSARMPYIYHIVAKLPNIQHKLSRDVDDLLTCKCDKSVNTNTLVHYHIVHAQEPWYN